MYGIFKLNYDLRIVGIELFDNIDDANNQLYLNETDAFIVDGEIYYQTPNGCSIIKTLVRKEYNDADDCSYILVEFYC